MFSITLKSNTKSQPCQFHLSSADGLHIWCLSRKHIVTFLHTFCEPDCLPGTNFPSSFNGLHLLMVQNMASYGKIKTDVFVDLSLSEHYRSMRTNYCVSSSRTTLVEDRLWTLMAFTAITCTMILASKLQRTKPHLTQSQCRYKQSCST